MAEGAWAAQQAVARAAFEGAIQRDSVRIDPGSVSVPVLLVWGQDDRVLPVRHAYDTLSSFPDAELAVISGTGHVPQIENAARTAQLIGRFVRGLG
jgi:pimeloyl-ACP methyl ester carboxylesterase